MTVTYTSRVASVSNVGAFFKLLLRWKGSIIKLVLVDLTIFLVLYYIFNFTYRFGLNAGQKAVFESVTNYCNQNIGLIPVAFILGFYVLLVIQRWLKVFDILPWPTRMAFFTTSLVQGDDEMGRLMRRTIQRYLTLSTVLLTRDTCPPVKKRFPTLQHVVDAGLLTENEMHVYENIPAPQAKYWVPLVWSTALVTRARKEGRIKDDISAQTMIIEIDKYRGYLMTLFNYDWIPIPLIYTQVTTLAVYTYFLACLMGTQFLEVKTPQNWIDMKVPIFTIMQFIFYVGWLKVAECMLNPFGEDDDDFEINYIIDCGFELAMLAVELHDTLPEMDKDAHWEQVEFELPYTVAAEKFKVEPHLGSAFDLVVSPKVSEFLTDDTCSSMHDEEGSPDGMRRRHPGSRLQRMFSNRSHGSGGVRSFRPRRQLSRTTSTQSQTSGQSNLHDRPLEPQSLNQELSPICQENPSCATVVNVETDDNNLLGRDLYSHRLDRMISSLSEASGASGSQDFPHTILEAVKEESYDLSNMSSRCEAEFYQSDEHLEDQPTESVSIKSKLDVLEISSEPTVNGSKFTQDSPQSIKGVETPETPSGNDQEKVALLADNDVAEEEKSPAAECALDETGITETTGLLK